MREHFAESMHARASNVDDLAVPLIQHVLWVQGHGYIKETSRAHASDCKVIDAPLFLLYLSFACLPY